MSEEINPHNLGPKVYKEEQVITFEDLEFFIMDIKGYMAVNLVDEVSEIKALAVINAFDILQIWIASNKTQELGFFQEGGQSE